MRITELFDGNKQWKWDYRDENQYIAVFKVGNIPYKFFAAQDQEEAPGDWELNLQQKQSPMTIQHGL